ncbi:MAG: polysaccharide deacetylase family protein [Syntrophomonadaceae bacterium]
MTKRKEYLLTIAIFLFCCLGSYLCWAYSAPCQFPKLLAAEAVVQPVEAASSVNTDIPTVPAAPTPSTQPVPAEVYTDNPVPVPILMYHKVNPYSASSLYRLWPEDFEWQMQYLKDNGYHTVSINDVLDQFEKHKKLPDKPVVITLDDGYRDNYLYAFPILKKYGFTATFYITTDYVAEPGSEGTFMTWDEIKELDKAGMTIGCHTLNHCWLTRVSWEEAWRQVGDSKTILEDYLGKKVDTFAYPYGARNKWVTEVIYDWGFRSAVTVNPRPVSAANAESPLELNRMGIYSNLSSDGFIYKINTDNYNY